MVAGLALYDQKKYKNWHLSWMQENKGVIND